MKPYQYIILGLVIAVALLAGFLTGKSYGNDPVEPIKEKVDTLYIRDTITLSKPIFVEREKLDSVLVPVTDTLRIQDTLFVYLERERVTWQDSLSIVYASGINPQIDSVKHFVSERVIMREVTIEKTKRTHWGLGVQAGYGVGKSGLSPYVGVGISYNLISW